MFTWFESNVTLLRRCYWLSIADFQLFASQTIRVYIMKKGNSQVRKMFSFLTGCVLCSRNPTAHHLPLYHTACSPYKPSTEYGRKNQYILGYIPSTLHKHKTSSVVCCTFCLQRSKELRAASNLDRPSTAWNSHLVLYNHWASFTQPPPSPPPNTDSNTIKYCIYSF
jgi:hypothetical protein